jgi:hypothetical protein
LLRLAHTYNSFQVPHRLIQQGEPSASLAISDRELSTSIVMNFEGVEDNTQVGSYYNGVGGPAYGVVFGASAIGLIDSDAGGIEGSIANEPSPSTVLYFQNVLDSVMSVPSGFTQLSFQYASGSDVTLTVFDGPGGAGTVLTSVTVPKIGICGRDGVPDCGDPTGDVGIWRLFTVPFSGVAKSVRFDGGVNLLLIDDMTVTVVDPPTCAKTTYWLWNPKTNAPAGELLNNSASCIAVPYNIEVRPCSPPATTPVVISLKNATTNGVIFKQNEFVAPFYLWGDNPTTGNVLNNKKPLPKGTYYLDSRVDGVSERIAFTKTC